MSPRRLVPVLTLALLAGSAQAQTDASSRLRPIAGPLKYVYYDVGAGTLQQIPIQVWHEDLLNCDKGPLPPLGFGEFANFRAGFGVALSL